MRWVALDPEGGTGLASRSRSPAATAPPLGPLLAGLETGEDASPAAVSSGSEQAEASVDAKKSEIPRPSRLRGATASLAEALGAEAGRIVTIPRTAFHRCRSPPTGCGCPGFPDRRRARWGR